eukprot:11219692-Lingulodinium_polyedra.AAC.1
MRARAPARPTTQLRISSRAAVSRVRRLCSARHATLPALHAACQARRAALPRSAQRHGTE